MDVISLTEIMNRSKSSVNDAPDDDNEHLEMKSAPPYEGKDYHPPRAGEEYLSEDEITELSGHTLIITAE